MLYEHLTVNEKGHLTLEGADVCDLAATYGTPLYLMDEGVIAEAARRYAGAAKRYYPAESLILYASKALSFKGIYSLMHREGLGADVASGGELYTALAGGMDPRNIFLHGNSKTDEELRYALEQDIGCIVLDNREEMERLAGICRSMNRRAAVSFRIKPGIEAHTHEFVKTGQIDSKFGVALETGEAFALIQQASRLDCLDVQGIHCHIGSQIFDTEPFALAAERMISLVHRVQTELGVTIRDLNLGGGFGVRYIDGHDPQPIESIVEITANAVIRAAEKLQMSLPRLLLEPGRSLVAAAGLTVYTVGSVKLIPHIRRYVVVDGGMNDNPRYALYQSEYTAVLPSRPLEKPIGPAAIGGRTCESGDFIGRSIPLPEVKAGELLAVLGTGAYNYSMSSHYNRIPKPPIVLVKNGESRVAVRRETWADVASMDV